jgi:uncharacterized BrkB/YihY/UPF0761 family membrane protein
MEQNDEVIIKRLTQAVSRVYESPHKLFLRQFLLGVFYGLGTTIGVAIVITLIGYLLKLLGGLPVIGNWLSGLSINLAR